MALWSGSTLYERHINGKRELWIPKGFTDDDLLYCWKVKYDLSSGKHFFVNVAGYGKAWRLPDIYDKTVQEQMRKFAEGVQNGTIVVNRAGTVSNTSSHAHQQHQYPHGHQEQHQLRSRRDSFPHHQHSGTGTPRRSSTASRPQHLPNTTDTAPVTTTAPIGAPVAPNDNLHNKQEMLEQLGGLSAAQSLDMMHGNRPRRNTPPPTQQQQQSVVAKPPTPPPPSAPAMQSSSQQSVQPREAVVTTFDYDGDDTWGAKPATSNGAANTQRDNARQPSGGVTPNVTATPPPQQPAPTGPSPAQRRLAEEEERLRREREAEMMIMKSGLAERNLLDPLSGTGVPVAAIQPVLGEQTHEVVGQMFERSSQLEASYSHHVVTSQQDRLASLSRSHLQIENERQLKDAAYMREMSELAAMEAEQAARIKAEAEEVRQRLSQSPPRNMTSPTFPSQRPTSPEARAALALQDETPTNRHVVATPTTEDGAATATSLTVVQQPSEEASRAMVLAMQQLDHERTLNAKLAAQVEERDRLLMQHMVADAERERREIALRIRMVEAMAAYRREHELEEQLDYDRREADALHHQLTHSPTWSSRYIPKHPLAGEEDEA